MHPTTLDWTIVLISIAISFAPASRLMTEKGGCSEST